MNLQISGHHIEVTPALREYVENKLDPVVRHFDRVTGVSVVLSVEKLKQKAEVTLHVPGKDLHVEESNDDLYAAIDAIRLVEDVGLLVHACVRHRPRLHVHAPQALGNPL